MKKLLTFVLLVLLAAVSYFSYITIFKKPKGTDTNQNPAKIKNYTSFVDCSDIRKVVEEGGKYYVACFGGVLIADAKSGQVLDQITMAEGLSDYVVTDLIKKGNTLYIGTQDGVTIWNLLTGTGKKLSVAQGLPSGANIILEEDGKYIWIGTFDGLARLDTEFNKLDVYKQELISSADEKVNVNGISTSGDYVYFSVVASAHSRGEVVRFNKVSGVWDKFTPIEFGDTSQYARIDAFGMCNVSDGVVFIEEKTLWKISNFEKTVPQKLFTAGFNDNIQFNTLCSDGKVLFKTNKNILVYEANKVRQADEGKDSAILAEFQKRENQGNYKKIFGDNFYGAFGNALGTVDNNVFISAIGGYWILDTSAKKLTKISAPQVLLDNNISNFVFWPIDKSARYVIAEQSCGMGCSKPDFLICNYPSNTCEKMVIPQNVLELIGPEGIANENTYDYFNLLTDVVKEKGKLAFKINYNSKLSWAVLDGDELSWSVEKQFTPDKNSVEPSDFCPNDNYYSFRDGVFSYGENYCRANTEAVSVGNFVYKFDQNTGAYREDKNSARENLNAPMSDAKYTPFGDSSWNKPQLNRLISSGDKVYYCTNRGLWIFDTKNSNWDLVSMSNGLLSNEVLDARVTSKGMVIITPAGISLLNP